MRIRIILLTLVLALPALAQQPRVPPRAVVNSASFTRPGLPNGKIARGSIFSIFGSRIGPDGPSPDLTFPLGKALAGVTVTVRQGDVSVDAIPLFVFAGQINAIMPSDAPLGRVSIEVRNGVRRANPAPAEVVASSVGIFSATGLGVGPASIQNFISQTVQPDNAPGTPAFRGQIVTAWGTGLGAVDFPDNEAPVPGGLDVEVEIWVGGAAVADEDVLYAGRSPCCSGVDQIIFRVPDAAPLGCYVPLRLRTAGNVVSNTVSMAIAEEGASECSDPANPFGDRFRRPGTLGTILLTSLSVERNVDVPEPATTTLDAGFASFRDENPGAFAFNPVYSLPPPGTCAVYTGSGDLLGGASLPGSATAGALLDAGAAVRVSGPRGAKSLAEAMLNPANYFAGLGSAMPGGVERLFLLPGDYTATSPGGSEVGGFNVSFAMRPPPTWSNRDEVGVVSRTDELELRWSGAEGTLIALVGNYDIGEDALAAALCTADAAAGSLTISPAVLSALPASSSKTFGSEGAVLLWTLPAAAAAFSADGLDAGFAAALSAAGKTVVFE